MAYSQQSRLLSLSTPLGKDTLLLTGFTGREGLTRPSRFTLDTLIDLDTAFDPATLMGAPVNFDVELDDGGYRVFNGIVHKVIPKGVVDKHFRRCQLHIITQLDMLKKSSDNRIFQHKSARDVIKNVLDDHKVSVIDATTGSYPSHEYCVQYQETDFQFVHRLLKEAGINYWIKHETGKHTVMLFDDKSTYRQATEPVIEYVDGDSAKRKFYHWHKRFQLNTGNVMQRSFNYQRPLNPVQSQTKTIATTSADTHEHYVYPALNNQLADSDLESRRHMESIENQQAVVSVSTTCRSLEPGQSFSFDKHVIDAELQPHYVITDIRYEAIDDTYLNQDSDTQQLESHLTCIPKETMYRRQKHYPRPTVHGVQTAIVCGPPGEEIYTDELGRVKVQFHWDRLNKRNENSSCWIRVAQAWADRGFGDQYLPRIGHEVMVHFEDGDMNKPVIMGSLYNGKNTPGYSLPANKTQSGIKTRSSKGADSAMFNEIRFEDKKGQEEFKIQAQKHQTTLIKDTQSRSIGNNQTASVGNSRYEIIKASRQTIAVGGHDNLQVQKDIAIQSVEGGIIAQAKKFIEFRSGGCTFTLRANGTIEINAQLVDIDGAGEVNVNSGNPPAKNRLTPSKVGKVFTKPKEQGTAIKRITVTPVIPDKLQQPTFHKVSRELSQEQRDYNTKMSKHGIRTNMLLHRLRRPERQKLLEENFNQYFKEVTGMTVDESIEIYKQQTYKDLTPEMVEKMFKDPEFAEFAMTNDITLHQDYRNILNVNAPQTVDEARALGYRKLGFLEAAYHQPTKCDKWIGPDGHTEVIFYRKTGEVNVDPEYKGTFNIFGPDQIDEHIMADVNPYNHHGVN